MLPRTNKRRILRHVKSGQVMWTPSTPLYINGTVIFSRCLQCYRSQVLKHIVMQPLTKSSRYLNKLMSFVSSNKTFIKLCLFWEKIKCFCFFFVSSWQEPIRKFFLFIINTYLWIKKQRLDNSLKMNFSIVNGTVLLGLLSSFYLSKRHNFSGIYCISVKKSLQKVN